MRLIFKTFLIVVLNFCSIALSLGTNFLLFPDSLTQYKTKIIYCPYKRVGNQRAILGNIIIKIKPIN